MRLKDIVHYLNMYMHASKTSNWKNYCNIQQFKFPIRHPAYENHGQKLILHTVWLSATGLIDRHITYLETHLTIADIIYETVILCCFFINPVTSLKTKRHLTTGVALITSADVRSYQMNVKWVKQKTDVAYVYRIRAIILNIFT
jgi:hypothetical protein